MAQRRHGPLSRAFVAANRVFGALTFVGGMALAGDFVLALVRGVGFAKSWIVGAFGLACIVIGVVYLRAPLTRD